MMSADRVTYLDASALVKLVNQEPESSALRRFLRGKRGLAASALVRAEVARAVMPLGAESRKRARDVVASVQLIRISDSILAVAGALVPRELPTLDAIHLATAWELEPALTRLVTYGERMIVAATSLGIAVASPRWGEARRFAPTRPPLAETGPALAVSRP